jgi:hypothetical protein
VETGMVLEDAELIEWRNLAGLAASTTPARDFRSRRSQSAANQGNKNGHSKIS